MNRSPDEKSFGDSARPVRPAPSVSGLNALEGAARAALDTLSGDALSDAAWARTRKSLMEFASILRSWEPSGRQRSSRLDNV